jgi:hypothetical protein
MPVPDFSPGEVLTAAAMDSIGLWKIAETTFTNAADAFIYGCFSSNYQNYCVVINASANGSGNIYFQMFSGTSTLESSAVYDRRGFGFSTTIFDLNAANQTDAYIGPISSTANSSSSGVVNFFRPNQSAQTMVNTHMQAEAGTVTFTSYRIETTTAYTGMKIFAAAGATTVTGTMRVYGYRN